MTEPYIAYWCDRAWTNKSIVPQGYCSTVSKEVVNRETIYFNESNMLIPTWEAFKEACEDQPKTKGFTSKLNPIDKTNPRMWDVGDTVTLHDGSKRLIVAMSNVDNPYESVATMEQDYEEDCVKLIHRYNRRDYGRVTGTNGTDSRDFKLENKQ